MSVQHLAAESYRIMWLFCFFDLPVETKKQRKLATGFRKDLLKDGFGMMQFSVYVRHCASRENLDVHVKRVSGFTPDTGSVSLLAITDKQFGNMVNLLGTKATAPPSTPKQLEMF
jgi:CRISPR-associated protein Cas2